MNIKMKLKHLFTIALAVLLSACTNPNNGVPIQSNNDGYSEYQNPPIDNPSITNTEALAVGAVGVATGYALAKQANKPHYSKPKASYSEPVVVVNKHYYQTKQKVRVARYKRK